MHVVYTCYGGAHSSPVAAALHLRQLPWDRVPTGKQLMKVPLFDRTTKEQHGLVTYIGTDEHGNKIYVLGRGGGHASVIRAVCSGLRLAERHSVPITFVDTLTVVNIWMRIGGFLSRAIGFTRLGRPLVIYGTRRAFPLLVALVRRTHEQLRDAYSSSSI